jgi:hypothetical protein
VHKGLLRYIKVCGGLGWLRGQALPSENDSLFIPLLISYFRRRPQHTHRRPTLRLSHLPQQQRGLHSPHTTSPLRSFSHSGSGHLSLLHNFIFLHPQSNGMTERAHRQLTDSLRSRLAGVHWPQHLPWVLLGLRAAPKEDSGTSSAELVHGPWSPAHPSWPVFIFS